MLIEFRHEDIYSLPLIKGNISTSRNEGELLDLISIVRFILFC